MWVPRCSQWCSWVTWSSAFNRAQSRAVIGLLNGHNILRRHLYLLVLQDSPLCRKCGVMEENSAHILCECEALASLRHAHLGSFFWHGYVLHEGITYKSRVPRTSQMTSRLLLHTAAAKRTHNMLRNSYNTRPLLCVRITCYVTVITVERNHCSFRRVRFALLYIVTRSKIV
jgi:hypothetical protein